MVMSQSNNGDARDGDMIESNFDKWNIHFVVFLTVSFSPQPPCYRSQAGCTPHDEKRLKTEEEESNEFFFLFVNESHI